MIDNSIRITTDYRRMSPQEMLDYVNGKKAGNYGE